MNKIKPKIGFRGGARENLLKDLNFAAHNHFDYFEISAEALDFTIKPEVIKKAREIANTNNISLNLHIPWFLQVGSLLPEISEATLNFIKKEVILASNLGVENIVIHSGRAEFDFIEKAIAKNLTTLKKNLNETVKFAKKYGIRIGLENTCSAIKLTRTPEELLKIIGSVKSLGMTFDIGHANVVTSDPIGYFKKVKNYIINIHIHDNDGKSDQHNLIGKGNINFDTFLKECKNSNYYGPFVLEIFPYKNALKSREIFLKIWDKI